MIGHLSKDNLHLIEEIGQSFASEAKYPGGFSLVAFSAAWRDVLALDMGKIFVYAHDEKIVAALGMSIMPDSFSGKLTAAELFWYVLPEYRKTKAGIELFREFELEAHRRGAKKLVMVHLAQMTPKELQGFYERNGYRLAEQTFWKEVE